MFFINLKKRVGKVWATVSAIFQEVTTSVLPLVQFLNLSDSYDSDVPLNSRFIKVIIHIIHLFECGHSLPPFLPPP